MQKLLTIILILSFGFGANLTAQTSPQGVWKTIDDDGKTEKSHVEIYNQDGKFYGKVTALLDSDDDPNPLCDECSGSKKNQPVLGMVILEGLKAHEDYWKNGTILDPENGNEYGCSVWFEDGKTDELKVRGKHWTGLYRTQTWYRVK